MTTERTPAEVRCNVDLGTALEDAADECLAALAGVDTYDVNLRNHPKAWAAIEEFVAKVQAAERERWTADVCNALAMLRSGDGELAGRMLAELVGA